MKDHPLAFIDLETTGLDPSIHEILEIGVVLADQTHDRKEPLIFREEFDIQVRPEHIERADPKALQVLKYASRSWDRQVSLDTAADILAQKLSGAVMVGQNVAFDFSFLQASFSRIGRSFDAIIHYRKIDSASIAIGKHYWDPDLSTFSLRELTQKTGVKNLDAHTALADARATFEVVRALLL